LGCFVIINIVVSVAVVFLALQLWEVLTEEDNTTQPQALQPRPLIITTTPIPGVLPAPALQNTISALETRLAQVPTPSPDRNATQPPIVLDSGAATIAALPTVIPEQGVPTLNLTIIAQVTLPRSSSGVDDPNAGIASDLPDVADGCERYVVQSGDTCIAIADRLGVDLTELMLLNQLDESCFLQVNQELRIPSASCRVPPTPTLTPTPTNTPFTIGTFAVTNTPLPTASASNVRILQVLNAGDITSELVEIENASDGVIPLLGWTLSDDGGNVFTFPDLLLQPGQRARVLTRAGENTPVALYWGLNSAVWQNGENVVLADAEGAVQAIFTVGQIGN
jgi:LysM repeat protein